MTTQHDKKGRKSNGKEERTMMRVGMGMVAAHPQKWYVF